MFEVLSTVFIWFGLAAIAFFGALVLDRIIRRLVNYFTRAQSRYPHRVANQLPRVLHKPDYDELIEVAPTQSMR